MGILDIFRKARQHLKFVDAKELGRYNAYFSRFGTDIYNSETVRSCIRPLAEFTSKATATCRNDNRLQRILNDCPNQYMTGRDFLQKVRTITEVKNTCFIYLSRNDRGKVAELYPVPYDYFQAVQYAGNLFIEFHFAGSETDKLVLPWADLVPIRKDYFLGDYGGESNAAILDTLEMISTTSQGLANAVKSTANLRGILKSTKTMLSPEDVKKQKDRFVQDYMSLSNEGGIASLDGTQEFTAISMNPVTASYEQMQEFRQNVYRYFGVNDNIIMANMTAEQLETFYEIRISPFLAQLSQALTTKIYSEKERAFGAQIVYAESKLAFASLDKKIKLFSSVVLYGGMLVNEWREQCGMEPIEGGDVRIMRLDAGSVGADGDAVEEEPDDQAGNEEESDNEQTT